MKAGTRHRLFTSGFGLLAAINLAFHSSETAPLPDFDKRTPAASPKPTAPAGLNVSRDPITGAPKFVTAARGFLTAPGSPSKTTAAKSRAAVGGDPHQTLKTFLNEHASLYGHGAEVLATATVTRDFTAAHNGLRTTVWQQQVDGIPVFRSVLVAHVTAKGELVNVASRFIPDPAAAAGNAARASAQTAPNVPATRALRIAAKNLGASLAETSPPGSATGAQQKRTFTASELRGEATTQLVWLPWSATRLALCWDVTLSSRARNETYQVLVDAQTGEALLRRCLTKHLNDATYNVFTSDSPSPFSPGWQTPQSGQPATSPRALITLSALSTNASPEGWIPGGGNDTIGNNVAAATDRNGDDAPDLPRPQGSPFRVFDFPLNLAMSPTDSGAAAVVQLFYWCNFMHDRLYDLGFTEAAGNFQSNNFGRGGLGGDAVIADAQDGSGFNNASFTPTPDGQPPRIQMYLFNGPNPDRDGDYDAEIILHEYTHGLSERLVGGGVGMSASQSGGMGEGWSDFYALAILSEPGDDPDAAYALGGYATYQWFGLTENYYYGIRRYPYSTDLAKNPLTFRDIDPAQANAHPGVPISPIFPFSAGNADEIHNQGEVWCVTLWEARANLIGKLGATNGNELILQLVTDGMKLAPADPTFLEARDAILQADEVATGGANLPELWAAFAKRGMGFNATSPASTTTTGVFESFDLPDDLRITPSSPAIAVGPVGGPFSGTNWSFTLTNIGISPVDWVIGTATNWLAATPGEGNLATGVTTTVTVSLTDVATNLPAGIFTASLRFTNESSGNIQSRQFTLSIGQPDDFFTELFSGNRFDLDHSTITFNPTGGANHYSACRMAAATFPTDPTGGTPLTLTDDSFATITLTGTNSVAIYAQRTNLLYLCSNGYLTFDAADLTNTTFNGNSYSDHFSRTRVAALFDDLNPASGGVVTRQELPDRIAITWLGVPLYGASAPNDFQLEMFYDGRIRVTWLSVNARNGLTGLSAGNGLPLFFSASDLTGFGSCANVPPELLQPTNVMTTAGGTAQFVSGADGSLPMNYQWKFNGTNLPAATNATLTLNNVTAANAGRYALAATNAFGGGVSSNALLTVLPATTLAAALDSTNLTWTTGGAAGWTGGNSITHDGTDAAQSGDIGDTQESWVQTVLTNGPGTLTFWWRVSSESGHDFLEFYTNSVLLSGRISGSVEWQSKNYRLPAGNQTLRWRYTKDGNLSNGSDSGWVDEVRFVPDVPLQFLPLQLNGDQLQLRVGSASTTALEAAQAGRIQLFATTNVSLPFGSWTLVTNATVFTNGTLELNGLSATNGTQRYYRASQNP